MDYSKNIWSQITAALPTPEPLFAAFLREEMKMVVWDIEVKIGAQNVDAAVDVTVCQTKYILVRWSLESPIFDARCVWDRLCHVAKPQLHGQPI